MTFEDSDRNVLEVAMTWRKQEENVKRTQGVTAKIARILGSEKDSNI
jgi:hypothetical protein